MASGEMSDDEFLAFNTAWIAAGMSHFCEGGVFGTFIDWQAMRRKSTTRNIRDADRGGGGSLPQPVCSTKIPC